jgi:hypothetical protein
VIFRISSSPHSYEYLILFGTIILTADILVLKSIIPEIWSRQLITEDCSNFKHDIYWLTWLNLQLNSYIYKHIFCIYIFIEIEENNSYSIADIDWRVSPSCSDLLSVYCSLIFLKFVFILILKWLLMIISLSIQHKFSYDYFLISFKNNKCEIFRIKSEFDYFALMTWINLQIDSQLDYWC